MKINIITVGKLKEKYLKDGIAEYCKRLSRFCELNIFEVEDEQAPDNLSHAQELQVKKKEADRILRKIKDGSTVIVLDVMGEKMGSEKFAAKLQSYFTAGVSNITFVIGGSLGLDSQIINSSKLRLSLSDMTFPHQLARLLLVEQLFRSFKILGGEVYHK